jgi:lipoprotein-anchoring transpeptidase ErfK/SrfK
LQRAVPDALGPYKLDTGDGYLIHGTNIFNEESIGDAVSHGCVRMSNEDLEKLYPMVPVGTRVFIF